MQNKIKSRLLALTCLATLAACSGSNSGNGGSSGQLQPEKITELAHPLFMDKLGVVPTKGSYLINVNNLSAKNYTLDSVKVTDASGKDQSNQLGISAQMCERLVANGTCSIEFTPRTPTSNTFLLTVGLRDSKNELHQVHQIVRISDQLGGDSGVSFATELGDVVTEKGDYRITIPVVLNEDFDKVEGFNGSLLCGSGGAGGFKKGSTCTYQISGKALADNTTVSANIRGYKDGKVVTEQTNNLNVRIADMPQLVLSQGVSLKADGTTEADVTVYNDGTADAAEIKYGNTLPNGKIISNSCEELKPNKMCKIQVTALSETHGSGRVTATYPPNRKVGTNISYTGTTNVGASVTSAGDSFDDILLGEEATKTITIKNIGNSPLSNLKVSLLKAGNDMTTETADTDGCGETLPSGSECSLRVKYKPSGVQVFTNAEALVTGTYPGEQGEQKSYSTRYQINYSAINPDNVLSIADPKSMQILANNEDSASQSITVTRTNAGKLPLTLTDIGFNKTVDHLIVDVENSSCKKSPILNTQTSTCNINLKYGPFQSPGTVNVDQISVNIKYRVKEQDKVLESKQFAVEAKAGGALVKLLRVTPTKPPSLVVTGNGNSIDNPYFFLALEQGGDLTLKYEFYNAGASTAKNLNIGAGDDDFVFPYGVVVKSNTCKREMYPGKDLGAGNSCELALTVPDPEIFNYPGHTGSSLDINKVGVMLPLSINYMDEYGEHTSIEQSKYVKFSRDWAKVTYSEDKVTKTSRVWHVEVTAKSAEDNKYMPIVIRVLQEPNTQISDAESVQGCTITDSGGCVLSFDLPLNKYPAKGAILFETELSSSQLPSASSKLRANHTVTYGD